MYEVGIKLKLLSKLLRDSGEYYAAFRIDLNVEEIGKYCVSVLTKKKVKK